MSGEDSSIFFWGIIELPVIIYFFIPFLIEGIFPDWKNRDELRITQLNVIGTITIVPIILYFIIPKKYFRNLKSKKNNIVPTKKLEVLKIQLKMSTDKEVFVTYSWDSEEHKSQALSFCNFLRENGFNANIDRKVSQEQSSADFSKMMHQGMTDYKKVIVILSKGYKKKADNFSGGVGTEYALIIKDINENPKKYILVSLEDITNEIFPLALRDREVIDLRKDSTQRALFAKLQDKDLVEFVAVAETKPIITPEKTEPFAHGVPASQPELEITNSNFSINVKPSFKDAQSLNRHYWLVEYSLIIEVENISKESVTDMTIEVSVNNDLTNYNSKGRIKDGLKIFSIVHKEKFYPQQEIEIECGNLRVENVHADKAFEANIEVKIYSNLGVESHLEKASNLLIVSDHLRRRKNLTIKDFHPQNARR